jgi:hypothetical protein
MEYHAAQTTVAKINADAMNTTGIKNKEVRWTRRGKRASATTMTELVS